MKKLDPPQVTVLKRNKDGSYEFKCNDSFVTIAKERLGKRKVNKRKYKKLLDKELITLFKIFFKKHLETNNASQNQKINFNSNKTDLRNS